MNTAQRKAAAAYLSYTDPYNHQIVIHNGRPYDDLLGPETAITGPSVQTHKPDFSLVHGEVLKWIKRSKEAGKQWAVAVDEPGDHEKGKNQSQKISGDRFCCSRIGNRWKIVSLGKRIQSNPR